MPVAETPNGQNPRPEDEVRAIERETDQLAETIDHAREAVLRAHDANSLSSEGQEYGGYAGEAMKPPEALEEGPETEADESGPGESAPRSTESR